MKEVIRFSLNIVPFAMKIHETLITKLSAFLIKRYGQLASIYCPFHDSFIEISTISTQKVNDVLHRQNWFVDWKDFAAVIRRSLTSAK